jgi:uncharacterized Zn-binding protein involved in type VI secretion
VPVKVRPKSDAVKVVTRSATPSSDAVLIMRATILNGSARLLFDGNTVARVGPPASAVVSVSPALS